MEFFRKNYRKIFPSYPQELKKAVGSSMSVLDVGCGSNSPVKFLTKDIYSVGVDIFEPSIEESRSKGIHTEYRKANALDIDKIFKEKSFDCVLASDLIEHLNKEDGNKLLDKMEKIASKKVIVFTPNGFIKQDSYNGNPWQVHKSGWAPKEMKERGFVIVGINGFKPLRGERSLIKYKPRIFWEAISDLTQLLYTRKKYKFAAQILCIKELKNRE
jgi:SAM-dependent methyltransferase